LKSHACDQVIERTIADFPESATCIWWLKQLLELVHNEDYRGFLHKLISKAVGHYAVANSQRLMAECLDILKAEDKKLPDEHYVHEPLAVAAHYAAMAYGQAENWEAMDGSMEILRDFSARFPGSLNISTSPL